MLTRAWRQRLGFTVAGASSASRKVYGVRSHTGEPSALVTVGVSSLAMKPRPASSKSCLSDQSRPASRSSESWAALVWSVASRRVSI